MLYLFKLQLNNCITKRGRHLSKQENIHQFTEKYEESFKQPTVKKFPGNPDSYNIFLHYIQQSKSRYFIHKLDKLFQKLYRKTKLGKYLDNFIQLIIVKKRGKQIQHSS